jgi:hypothetical protein
VEQCAANSAIADLGSLGLGQRHASAGKGLARDEVGLDKQTALNCWNTDCCFFKEIAMLSGAVQPEFGQPGLALDGSCEFDAQANRQGSADSSPPSARLRWMRVQFILMRI